MPVHSNIFARPRLACEITSDRVIAARVAENGEFVEAHTSRTLPSGAVRPSLTESNIADSAALSSALSDALGALSRRLRDVITVIPDAVVRVVLLDFDSLPENRREAEGVIRFRLRKSLPFDIDQSVISYHAHRSSKEIKVVAAVALASVVQEYEAAVQQAGYAPGVVLPSTLASLGAVDAERPTLVVKINNVTATVAIVDQQELRLFRTLEHSGTSELQPARLAEDVYPSLVFFQDNFGASIERVLIGGSISSGELAPALQSHTEAPVEDLVAGRNVSGGFSAGTNAAPLAGVVGALLS